MNKAIFSIALSALVAVPVSGTALPSVNDYGVELSSEEMHETRGQVFPAILLTKEALLIASGATLGAIAGGAENAVTQAKDGGDVDGGEVAINAAAGAALGAMNVGAALTKNVLVIGLAGAVDIAASVASAAAEGVPVTNGTPPPPVPVVTIEEIDAGINAGQHNGFLAKTRATGAGAGEEHYAYF